VRHQGSSPDAPNALLRTRSEPPLGRSRCDFERSDQPVCLRCRRPLSVWVRQDFLNRSLPHRFVTATPLDRRSGLP
jgi:hypothetical protein